MSQAGGTAWARCFEAPVYLACPRTHLEAGVLGPEQEKEHPEEGRAGVLGLDHGELWRL